MDIERRETAEKPKSLNSQIKDQLLLNKAVHIAGEFFDRFNNETEISSLCTLYVSPTEPTMAPAMLNEFMHSLIKGLKSTPYGEVRVKTTREGLVVGEKSFIRKIGALNKQTTVNYTVTSGNPGKNLIPASLSQNHSIRVEERVRLKVYPNQKIVDLAYKYESLRKIGKAFQLASEFKLTTEEMMDLGSIDNISFRVEKRILNRFK